MSVRVSKSLLEKYDRPGPRYTSYPTAPCWSDFTAADYEQRLRASAVRADEPVSLYVHLPFCEKLCWFCGCSVVVTQKRDKAAAYVDRILREAALVRNTMGCSRPVAQYHWGGGTPTFLPPEQIRRLYLGLHDLFPNQKDAEISIEVDPRVTTTEQLQTLSELGFNRISMGVQDFDPAVQEAIHRVQGYQLTRELIEASRSVGFESVNVDLIYGLPHQTVTGFSRTIEQVLELRPDRVACYSYAYVPWLKKHQNVIPAEALPTSSAKLDLYLTALRSFQEGGFSAIGMDHFAQGDDDLAIAAESGSLHRNFQGYSTHPAEEMLSFGVTAIGEMDRAFVQNLKTLPEWEQEVDAGRLPCNRGLLRSPADEERRRMILDLMCKFRLDFKDHGGEAFRRRFETEMKELAQMADDGLIEIHPDHLRVTRLGRLLIRNIAMVFDEWLRHERQQAGKPAARYSRTV